MPTKIRIENVTKIFGETPDQEPLSLLQSGISKDEILQKTGHVVGLADVSLTVDEGEIFVVMGLSGSGKSTLIRTVNRLIDPTAGHIYVDDQDVATADTDGLRALRRTKMSMVFQHFGLFPHRTVIENVSYGLKVRGISEKERRAKAMESLEMVGLDEWASYYPHNLSGGMQQRVGLARALAADTDILLMDEAFSALDPLIRGQMQEELLGLQEKLQKTILFITHDLNEALRVGSRIAVMRDGAVVQIGTPVEIVTQPADKYVADFTQDVDVGRVLSAQFVMQPPHSLQISDSVETALAQMNELGRTALYVVDDQSKPQGVITRAGLEGEASLSEALQTTYPTTTATTPLIDLYASSISDLPLAVLNQDGTIAGVITSHEVLAGLAFKEIRANHSQTSSSSTAQEPI